jgi:hypothetical protein
MILLVQSVIIVLGYLVIMAIAANNFYQFVIK